MNRLIRAITFLELKVLKQPPASTLLILLVTLAVNIAVILWNRRTVDQNHQKQVIATSQRAQRNYQESLKSGNKKRIAKAERIQENALKAQMEMTKNQAKNSLILTLPLFLILPPISGFFGADTIVAILPFSLPFIGQRLNYFWWYTISSLFTRSIVGRILGTAKEAE